MIKIIGILMIITACSAFGMRANRRLTIRVQALSSMITAINIIKSEILFKQTQLPEIIEILTYEANPEIRELFKKLQKEMQNADEKTFSHKFTKVLNENEYALNFHKEDTKILSDLGFSLGRYDVETQANIIEYTKQRLDMNLSKAIKEREEQGRIYKTIGIGLGVIISMTML